MRTARKSSPISKSGWMTKHRAQILLHPQRLRKPRSKKVRKRRHARSVEMPIALFASVALLIADAAHVNLRNLCSSHFPVFCPKFSK